MSDVSDLLRRLPRLFYLAAAAFFVWKIANSYAELSATASVSGGAFDEKVGALLTLQKSKALFLAVQDALYFVANGAMLQVLIAIHDRLVSK